MSLLYTQAAQCLAPCLTTASAKSSLKSRALKSDNQPATMALACETLKFRGVIDDVLKKAGGLSVAALVQNEALGYVLVYELLFGSGTIRGGGGAKRSIAEHATALRASLAAVRAEHNAESDEDLLPESLRHSAREGVVRYARVNYLKTKDVASVQRRLAGAAVDEHLPYVLRLPPGGHWHANALVRDGTVILQDKSSCFPAHALALALKASDAYPCDVLDATAAPGNKTTQLAALLTTGRGAHCRVLAMDRSADRFKLLCKRIEQAGASSVCEAVHGDFLALNPGDSRVANVKAILLDPSCSGSGTVLRNVERLVEPAAEQSSARIRGLVEFQTRALGHALDFPQVRFVSYSTCSVFTAENEAVVAAVLESRREHWELVCALPQWPRRGVADGPLASAEAALVARADAELDGTGGFFVAVFKRRAAATRRKRKKPASTRPLDSAPEAEAKRVKL